MNDENVMSEELAFHEVEKWADENCINIYVKNKDGETALDAAVQWLTKAIMMGTLILNDENEFEYTVSNKSPNGYAGEKLIFKEPNGGAYMAMDKFKDQEGVHKTLAVASAITGKDIPWFGKISNFDYKICATIASFFIAG